MKEFSILLAVLLFLYFVECGVWIPPGSVSFRLQSNPKRAIRMLTKPRAMARPDITFVFPFSFRGGVVVFPLASISICPRGITVDRWILAEASQTEFVAFENISSIEAIQRELVVNGTRFAVAASEGQAAKFETIVKRLKARTLPDRSAEIERELSQSLDADLIRSKLDEYIKKTSELSIDSFALFVTIFMVSPIVVWRWGLVGTWPFLLCSVVLIVALTAWDYHRTNLELFPTSSVSQWRAIASILLSPPAAMHATKYLARDLGRDCHPLALAAARCSKEDYRTLASWVLRDLRFPRETGEPGDILAADCTDWFARQLGSAVSSLLRTVVKSQRNSLRCPRVSQALLSRIARAAYLSLSFPEGYALTAAGFPCAPSLRSRGIRFLNAKQRHQRVAEKVITAAFASAVRAASFSSAETDGNFIAGLLEGRGYCRAG